MSKLRCILPPLISKFNRSFNLQLRTKNLAHHKRDVSRFTHISLSSVAFFTWLLTANQIPLTTHFDAEKQISQMISQAEACIKDEKIPEAKKILIYALKVADDNQAYGSLSYLCDLFSSIVLSEGDIVEAENMLVKFTEKLLQLGYSESHNSIVKFKLKLARLYQLFGCQEMAEYGLRDCIRVQEKKMENMKKLDGESNRIYLSALFWYGKLLADEKEFARARNEYKKCLERISKGSDVLTSQKMIVLHHIASVSAILKNFDAAISYLSQAIEICLLEDPSNQDLPIYAVQVGLLYLQKGIYERASFWCHSGLLLASHVGNQLAEKEGEKCIQELRKLKILELVFRQFSVGFEKHVVTKKKNRLEFQLALYSTVLNKTTTDHEQYRGFRTFDI